jgi:hypothetical protein
MKKLLYWIIAALVGITVLVVLYAVYAYAATPLAIRNPKSDHLHFRIQVLVNGETVNFADSKFQTDYNKDFCSATLTKEPFHFHDGRDQFAHIHWEGMTGGLFLKSYGWNFIGGLKGLLGYQVTAWNKIMPVPTHGNALPKLPANTNFYVYSGDEAAYREKSWQDFLHQPIETFFGRSSNLGVNSVWSWIIPAASAHGGATDEELTEINNLVGNVVIFVQKDRPTDTQVKDRFNKLVPLTDSVCGG